MKTIGNFELSDYDFDYLIDGLAKIIPQYPVDRSSNKDINFIRQMMIIHKKLERKRKNLKKQNNDKK